MPNNVLRVDLSAFKQPSIENLNGQPYQASVAVVPFYDQDDICRQQQIGHWLGDDLAHHLSRFRSLSVLGHRASDILYASHDDMAIMAQRSGMDYLATGMVRMLPTRLSAIACLVDGPTGKTLWHSTYEVSGKCLPGLEDDLARRIATGVAASIEAVERRQMGQQHDPNEKSCSIASLIFMADHLSKQFRQDANRRARQLVKRALDINTSSAKAFAILSRTHHLDARYAWSKDPDRSSEQSIRYAIHATQLDPMEASGHSELGMNWHYAKDYDAAAACYQRAIDINPSDPDILAECSDLVISSGEPEQAIEPLTLAIHLRPDRASLYRYYLASAFDVMGDDETVISIASMISDNHEGHRLMAASYARLGMTDKAAHQADLARRAQPTFSLDHWRTVLPHRDADVRAHIIEGHERAGFH